MQSSIENTGNNPGPPITNFSFVSFRVITAPEFISEPVAGSVSTVPKGIPFCIAIFLAKISHRFFPLKRAAADKNLVPSITEPPPTANKKVIFSFLITCKASIKTAYSGFAGIPPNSIILKLVNDSFTWV